MENVGLMVALAGAMTKAPTAEQVSTAVDAWLDDHPEATTTVEDGSITNAKLASSFVTPGTAAAYSSSATYAVGDYVFYDGALYRCTTPITTAEAWTAAHWTAAVLGDDVSDLKRAFTHDDIFFEDRAYNGEYKLTWTDGKYINTSGGIGNHNSCSATLDYIPIRKGDVLSIYCHAPGQIDAIAIYDISFALVEQFTWAGKTAGAKSYTVAQDGFIRMSNEPSQIANANCYLKVTNISTINGISNALNGMGEDVAEIEKTIKVNIPFEYELDWTNGKYIISTNGTVGTASTMACTRDYYPVYAGQRIKINMKADGSNECAVAFYSEQSASSFTGYITADGEKTFTVEADGFARFSTKTAVVPVSEAYAKSLGSEQGESGEGYKKNYFIRDYDAFSMGETARQFVPTTQRLDYQYKGDVTPNKRFLAIGFDDFRNSDFSAIIPLFEKYAGVATFNKVITSTEDTMNEKMNSVIMGRHEVGDHTFMHYAFPYEDALFNGQNPSSPDGSQTPYPTNAQLREDAGNGKNAFYLSLTGKVSNIVANSPLASSVTWGDLTDEQCQTLREYYSVFKNPTLSVMLDTLSNKYLGTTGASAGSWDNGTGKYTGGIFTGCATSENHEVWERILQIVQCYYKDQYGLNWDLQCWSWPGEYYFGIGFSSDGYSKYYRADMSLLYNMNARFTSSLYVDELGNAKVRSFADVLREFGYKYTHDIIYPGRLDYQAVPAMRKQFYINEHLSKQDGVLYPTDRTVTYSSVANSYPSTFFTTGKTKGSQMYDANGAFRDFIEALRKDTANGLIHGEVMDSVNNYSMRVFFEEALRFCKSAGIEVITKAQAYDVCFNHSVETGNLIYNPSFRNTAEEFFTDATNVPTNPDGYSGSCSVTVDASGNILSTTGETVYVHYGIPLGKIKYSAEAKGNGTITIYLIKCGSNENLTSLTQLVQISVNSPDSFAEASQSAIVPDNPIGSWGARLEGRGDKIMGLKIAYSSGLQIKNIRLEKC